ncbi:class I SAM-dependent methyltransferase [Paenibacillus profundus]|uniref:Class I SAM-dependent methyltransferase n=1 Tax=Paenibacillus profundus TaxID=1173085 RepID=A0ABS8Y8W8_9BACL|nr:class I SAM-dependent methyltransferase [Paenibacillus profundus]MCE5168215.1 class I SAM-dependent methyltransferase [Paenibacillus profundus]
MYPKLSDPKTHKDWLSPHSFAWYAQIGKLTGKYSYSWNSMITEPNGEALFTNEVSQMVRNKIVLDVGCGHGDFTIQWSPIVNRIIGLDVTSDFIIAGSNRTLSNVSFVTGNTRDRLPFDAGEFDCVYNRRGPTSAYVDISRVVKKGGQILGLHPGDRLSAELPQLFPNLFEPHSEGTPILDKIKNKLEAGALEHAEVETVTSIQYLHEPMDVVKVRCFGQTPSVFEMVINECMSEIERIFHEHATERGLPTTFEHYIVRAAV